jgi:hypothetical protein
MLKYNIISRIAKKILLLKKIAQSQTKPLHSCGVKTKLNKLEAHLSGDLFY